MTEGLELLLWISNHPRLLSPGVVLGNATNPMTNVTFDGVRVRFGARPRGAFPWGRKFRCAHAAVRSVGGTQPAVECTG